MKKLLAILLLFLVSFSVSVKSQNLLVDTIYIYEKIRYKNATDFLNDSVDMNSFRIKNLATALELTDAINLQQLVDSMGAGGNYWTQSAGVLSPTTPTDNISITNSLLFDGQSLVSVATGVANNDVMVTRGYVDDNAPTSLLNFLIRGKNAVEFDNYIERYFTDDLPVMTDDASGLTYNPLTNTVFIINNDTEVLYEYDINLDSGDTLRSITLTNFTDIEGICWMKDTTYAVCQEGPTGGAYIYIITIGATTTTFDEGDATKITTTITSQANKGLEGVSYDNKNNWFYVVTEKNADGSNGGRAFKVEMDGTSTEFTQIGVEWDDAGYTDMSDCYYDNDLELLHILSDESAVLIKTKLDGTFLDTMAIDARFSQPEGLVFKSDGSLMFICGEFDDYGLYVRHDENGLDVVYNHVTVGGILYDVNTQAGTSGQVLSSTATGIDWIDNPTASTDKETGFNLDAFKEIYSTNNLVPITVNASDVAYNDSTGTVFIITENPDSIFEYTKDAQLLRVINLNSFDDPEGFTWMSGNLYAISMEYPVPNPYIYIIEITEATSSINEGDATKITTTITTTSLRGLEGVTFHDTGGDMADNWFYVCAEKRADGSAGGRVFKVEMDGTSTEYTDLTTSWRNAGWTDMASLWYDNHLEHIYILSDESDIVVKARLDGTLLDSIDVNTDIFSKPEGLSFEKNGKYMFISGEPDDYAYYTNYTAGYWEKTGSSISYLEGIDSVLVPLNAYNASTWYNSKKAVSEDSFRNKIESIGVDLWTRDAVNGEVYPTTITDQLGIGTVNPKGTAHFVTALSGVASEWANADDMIVENDGVGGVSILIPDAYTGNIVFGSPSDSRGANVQWNYDAGEMTVGSHKTGASVIFKSAEDVTALTLDGSQDAIFVGDITSATITLTNAINEFSTDGTLVGDSDDALPTEKAVKTYVDAQVGGAVTPTALTKSDDTNVTLVLGGTPNTALLQATSLTLGWAGTLADGRITSSGNWNIAYDSVSVYDTRLDNIEDDTTNWNTAYDDRLKWDGGATDLVAGTGRTSLGATTVGSNLFTLTNPSAIRFIRINADNTVSALSDSDFRTAIGAGVGGGTVTSVTAGNGMDFAEITASGPVTMGTPSTLTSATSNAITTTSHTHEITTGIAVGNIVKASSGLIAEYDYAKFTITGLEGRSYSEVKTDLSLNSVENTALSTWVGTTNITTLGTIATGTWSGNIITIAKGGTNSSTALNNDFVIISNTGAIKESSSITTAELGLLNGIASVSTGIGDNDKFVTQGYVDDAISGAGGGTVTSVGFGDGAGFTIAGSPITASGSFTFTQDFSEFTDITESTGIKFIVTDPLEKEIGIGNIDLSDFNNDSGFITGNQTTTLSGDITGAGTTAITTTIGAGKVIYSMFNEDVIYSQTAIGAALVSTDELLVADGSFLRKMDISVLATFLNTNTSMANVAYLDKANTFSQDQTFSGELLAANGSSGNPAFSFSGDPDNGMYLSAENQLSWATLGIWAMTIEFDQDISIAADLTVASGKIVTSTFQMTNAPTNGYYLKSDASGNATWASVAGGSSYWDQPYGGTLVPNTLTDSVGIGGYPNELFTVYGSAHIDDNLIVGGDASGYLSVADSIAVHDNIHLYNEDTLKFGTLNRDVFQMWKDDNGTFYFRQDAGEGVVFQVAGNIIIDYDIYDVNIMKDLILSEDLYFANDNIGIIKLANAISGNAYDLQITGSNSEQAGNTDGGDVILTAGTGYGTGQDGKINIAGATKYTKIRTLTGAASTFYLESGDHLILYNGTYLPTNDVTIECDTDDEIDGWTVTVKDISGDPTASNNIRWDPSGTTSTVDTNWTKVKIEGAYGSFTVRYSSTHDSWIIISSYGNVVADS